MIRRTLLAATVLAVLLPSQMASALPGSLLSNGEFDSGLGGWALWGDGSCSHSVGGALSSYRGADTSPFSSCGIYQTVVVAPGDDYVGSAYVHVKSGTVQVYLRWVDAFGNDVTPFFPVATSVGSAPQLLTVAGTAPSGASYARFWFYCTTSLTCDYEADFANLYKLP